MRDVITKMCIALIVTALIFLLIRHRSFRCRRKHLPLPKITTPAAWAELALEL